MYFLLSRFMNEVNSYHKDATLTKIRANTYKLQLNNIPPELCNKLLKITYSEMTGGTYKEPVFGDITVFRIQDSSLIAILTADNYGKCLNLILNRLRDFHEIKRT